VYTYWDLGSLFECNYSSNKKLKAPRGLIKPLEIADERAREMADKGLTCTLPWITGYCAAARRALRAGIRVPFESAQSRAAAIDRKVTRRVDARAPFAAG
jgi:hypothetical protein